VTWEGKILRAIFLRAIFFKEYLKTEVGEIKCGSFG
jgi:hypothetical protein